MHTLNIRFINLEARQTATIVRDGFTVQVTAYVAEGKTFGSIVYDISTERAALSSGPGGSTKPATTRSLPLVIMKDQDQMAGPEVTAALDRLEDVLESVGRLVRRRFDGKHSPVWRR